MCDLNKITVGKLNNIINPLRLVCNNYKCKYRYSIRKFSFLKKFQKTTSYYYNGNYVEIYIRTTKYKSNHI